MNNRLICLLVIAALAPRSATADTSAAGPRAKQVVSNLASAAKDDRGRGGLTLADRMRSYDVPGVSIALIDDGKIAWAKSYGARISGIDSAVDLLTLFQAASISKPVTAVATLRLVQAGKLDLDTDANQYLKSWQVPDNEFTTDIKVSLRDLLTHTAGTTVSGFLGYRPDRPLPTTGQILDGVTPARSKPVRVTRVPGTRYEYSGGGAVVMTNGGGGEPLCREVVHAIATTYDWPGKRHRIKPDPGTEPTPVPENLELTGVPPIPQRIAETASRYSHARSAGFASWHPTKREMLIRTRFAETSQVHHLNKPSGARHQLTFFKEPVGGVSFQPEHGDFFCFSRDVGGGEFYQNYRFDLTDGSVTLLTDGEKRNSTGVWSEAGDRIAYSGGLVSPSGETIYAATDKSGEFRQLHAINVKSQQHTNLSGDIDWDVTDFDLAPSGDRIVFTTNEAGTSGLYLLDTETQEIESLVVPVGIISSLQWHSNGDTFAFSFSSATSPSDVFSYRTAEAELVRWTESETGPIDLSELPEPRLIKWKSFDDREISGFLYPPPEKFTGQRPVIVKIHGGPESQSRPGFLGRLNYFINELGIAVILPNVRGSRGYGKSFLKLDNALLREGTYRDIEALLRWIGDQDSLDADRILVTGGSYGGHMTLATAARYNDLIRCSIDVVGISNLRTF